MAQNKKSNKMYNEGNSKWSKYKPISDTTIYKNPKTNEYIKKINVSPFRWNVEDNVIKRQDPSVDYRFDSFQKERYADEYINYVKQGKDPKKYMENMKFKIT